MMGFDYQQRFRSIVCLAILLCLPISPTLGQSPEKARLSETIQNLKVWLGQSDRPKVQAQSFFSQPLSKAEADQATKLLWNDYLRNLKSEREQEWTDKRIKIDELEMKFEFKTFGKKPESGRRLFISMHGGGGAPARVNEQQWRNQIGLYQPEEGVYLAPRAPTDTWNLWHQSHIDKFFARIIQDAVLFEDVDPNHIYLMGYSAGGDGVYQLAPRMADSLAAAAMMAGHPNDASPLGLRNIGFTIHMGGKDAAFKRNEVAKQWKGKLEELQQADPKGYQHKVVIHEKYGHWMNRDDAVAVPWMAKFKRNPRPNKIVWHQSSTTHDQFYWLGVTPGTAKKGDTLVVSRDGQTIKVEKVQGIEDPIELFLNDQILDLDQPIVVEMDGEKRQRKVNRTIAAIHKSIESRGDPEFIYSASFKIPLTK